MLFISVKVPAENSSISVQSTKGAPETRRNKQKRNLDKVLARNGLFLASSRTKHINTNEGEMELAMF